MKKTLAGFETDERRVQCKCGPVTRITINTKACGVPN